MSDSAVMTEVGPRRIAAAVPIAGFGCLVAGGLFYAKWWPYSQKLLKVLARPTYPARSLLSAARPGAVSWSGGWHFTVAYGKAVWVALVAALLIGAGVETLLPSQTLQRSTGGGRVRASLAGGVASVPCMMCTCCSAPLVRSLRRSGVTTEAALAFWLGNPLLNPVVITFLALVLPWPYAVGRVLAGLMLVFVAVPLIARLGSGRVGAVPFVGPDRLGSPDTQDRRRYVVALARLALVLVPEYFLVVLLVGAFRGVLFPRGHSTLGWGVLAAVAAAALGALIVVPTAGEVPVVLGLLSTGFSPLVAGAAMVALPALSLPSIVMVGRSLPWRVVAMAAVTVAVAAVAAGGLVTLLGAR